MNATVNGLYLEKLTAHEQFALWGKGKRAPHFVIGGVYEWAGLVPGVDMFGEPPVGRCVCVDKQGPVAELEMEDGTTFFTSAPRCYAWINQF